MGAIKLDHLLFKHQGRISRVEFFVGAVLATITFCCVFIELMFINYDYNSNVAKITLILALLGWLYTMSCLCVKRLHDFNFSGWNVPWIWATGVAVILFNQLNFRIAVAMIVINSIAALVLFLIPGTRTLNKFDSNT